MARTVEGGKSLNHYTVRFPSISSNLHVRRIDDRPEVAAESMPPSESVRPHNLYIRNHSHACFSVAHRTAIERIEQNRFAPDHRQEEVRADPKKRWSGVEVESHTHPITMHHSSAIYSTLEAELSTDPLSYGSSYYDTG